MEERKFPSLKFLMKAQLLGVERIMFIGMGLFEYAAE
jgi:hypothetical protein